MEDLQDLLRAEEVVHHDPGRVVLHPVAAAGAKAHQQEDGAVQEVDVDGKDHQANNIHAFC